MERFFNRRKDEKDSDTRPRLSQVQENGGECRNRRPGTRYRFRNGKSHRYQSDHAFRRNDDSRPGGGRESQGVRQIAGCRKIKRIFPCLEHWEVSLKLSYDEKQISLEALHDIFEYCGNYVGIGDYRPMFGRFTPVCTKI